MSGCCRVLSFIFLLSLRLVQGQSSREKLERNETDTDGSMYTWLKMTDAVTSVDNSTASTDAVISFDNTAANWMGLQPTVIPGSHRESKSDENNRVSISIRAQDSIENQGKMDLLRQLEFLAFGCFYPFMLVLGITTSVLTLLLLRKNAFGSTSSVYIAALAVSDILYLICRLTPTLNYYRSNRDSLLLTTIYGYFFVHVNPLKHIVYPAGIWIMMAFTIERFSAVYFPLKAKLVFNKVRANLVVITIYVLMIILNASEFWRRRVNIQRIDGTNKWRAFSATELGDDVNYKTARTAIYLLSCILPFPVLTVLNIMIVVKLHRVAKMRASNLTTPNRSTKSREQHVTRLLVWLVCVFIVCNAMEAIAGVFPSQIGKKSSQSKYKFELEFTFLFARVVVVCNPFLNFILYVCSNKDLRNNLLQIVTCRSSDVSNEPHTEMRG